MKNVQVMRCPDCGEVTRANYPPAPWAYCTSCGTTKTPDIVQEGRKAAMDTIDLPDPQYRNPAYWKRKSEQAEK